MMLADILPTNPKAPSMARRGSHECAARLRATLALTVVLLCVSCSTASTVKQLYPR
jgi:hypothetical protein